MLLATHLSSTTLPVFPDLPKQQEDCNYDGMDETRDEAKRWREINKPKTEQVKRSSKKRTKKKKGANTEMNNSLLMQGHEEVWHGEQEKTDFDSLFDDDKAMFDFSAQGYRRNDDNDDGGISDMS